MSKTATFRDQHARILGVANSMELRLAGTESPKAKASELRRLLSSLVGKLAVHLAMEDETLYPRLLAHADKKVAELAQRYIDEMGGLSAAVRVYADRWPTPLAIEQDLGGFEQETLDVLRALKQRIAREDGELYRLVDAEK